MFQSLLFWKSSWKNPLPPGVRIPERVSILVVLEVVLEDDSSSCYMLKTILFQSLFVLEVVLEAVLFPPSTAITKGFNPCCSGSRPGSDAVERPPVECLEFQSLLFWKSSWKSLAKGYDPGCFKFQSLLFWKSSWKDVAMSMVFFVACFNPCCSGSRPGRLCLSVSLVDMRLCFNPCCSGSRPGRVFPTYHHSNPLHCFNPCCSGSRPGSGSPPLHRHLGHLGFNPCCSGSRPGRVVRPGDTPMELWVSILVVLEVVLEAIQLPRFKYLKYSFNPCCSGSRPGSAFAWSRFKITLAFQSLLFWKSSWKTIETLTALIERYSFNPCCSGSRPGSQKQLREKKPMVSFNPCCSGSRPGRPGPYL